MSDPRARIDEQVIATWAAAVQARDARWRRTVPYLLGISAVLVLLVVLASLPLVLLLVVPMVWGIANLLVGTPGPCPVCGRNPSGTWVRQAQGQDHCVHCLHWLVHPLRRAR